MMHEVSAAAEVLPRMKKALSEFGLCRLVVTGGSMLPFLHSRRDAVLLEPFDGTARVGDILFYQRSENFCVLHRVHRMGRDGLMYCTGDMQSQLEPVRPEQVIARVQAVEVKGRRTPVTAFSYRLRSALWYPTRPIRPLMARVYLSLRQKNVNK